MDLTLEEAACSSRFLEVAVTPRGGLCGATQQGTDALHSAALQVGACGSVLPTHRFCCRVARARCTLVLSIERAAGAWPAQEMVRIALRVGPELLKRVRRLVQQG